MNHNLNLADAHAEFLRGNPTRLEIARGMEPYKLLATKQAQIIAALSRCIDFLLELNGVTPEEIKAWIAAKDTEAKVTEEKATEATPEPTQPEPTQSEPSRLVIAA